MSLFSQPVAYWRFAWGLRGFLREPVSLEQSREIIRQRLQNREQNLLTMVKRAIYDNESSPYLRLLELASCEYGDFEKMVLADGIESALSKIYQAGVYISIEEFKGKKEVVRSGNVFRFKESDFNNPFLVKHFEASSGASRSPGTRVIMSLDRYYYNAAHSAVTLAAHGIWGKPVLLWMPILPSAAGLIALLWLAKTGHLPIRWFSQVESRTVKPALVKRLATYYAVYASRLFGSAFPKPEYVSLEEAHKVTDCLAEVLKKGQGCILWTYANSAVRVCQASRKRQLDLSGTTFVVAGEPLTGAKMREIRTAGANVVSVYVITEVGNVGFSCAGQTVAPDDIHLFKESHAVIQHRREVPFSTASVDAFLFTSLLHKSAKILLNVESGDYGVIETRKCGCQLEELGLTDHIYNIRSFDKLTGEGMTFAGTDILRIIEEVLPAKFGGTSTDYQMVEEEDEQGYTSLSLSVNPEVGAIDEGELIKTVLSELRKGNDTQRMMTEIWAQAKTLRVKRQRPLITAAGKLLPLHIQKAKRPPRTH